MVNVCQGIPTLKFHNYPQNYFQQSYPTLTLQWACKVKVVIVIDATSETCAGKYIVDRWLWESFDFLVAHSDDARGVGLVLKWPVIYK